VYPGNRLARLSDQRSQQEICTHQTKEESNKCDLILVEFSQENCLFWTEIIEAKPIYKRQAGGHKYKADLCE